MIDQEICPAKVDRRRARLPESTDAPDGHKATPWPLRQDHETEEAGYDELIADLLADLLERSGYRQFGTLIDGVRVRTVAQPAQDQATEIP